MFSEEKMKVCSFCTKKSFALLAVTLIAALLCGTSVSAAGGTLDPTFGTNGIVSTQFSGLPSSVLDVALQTDGKIVVLGDRQWMKALARYNNNGTLDSTFGVSGVAPIEITPFFTVKVALQTDGKIIVGGSSSGRFAVARFNTNGSLDTSFGTNGLAVVPSSAEFSTYSPSDLLIQPNGQIVMVATETNQGNFTNFAVARFDGSGAPEFARIFDKSDFPNNRYNGASAVVFQPDNKIVVSGDMMDDDANQQLTLMRLNQDGWLDKSNFGTNGKGTVQVSIPNFSHSNGALALQPDGKIVAAGSIVNDDNKPVNGVLVRLLGNGSVDTTFGGTGIVIADFGANEAFDDFIIQPDGKIVVEGKTGSLTASDFLLVRYNSDGTLDTSFGTNGKVVTDLGNSADTATGIARQIDGKAVVVGTSGDKAILARFETGAAGVTNTTTFKSVNIYDGWILESGENTNKGGTLDKASNAIFVGDGTKDRQYRGILSFDTVSIPDNAVVTAAQLKVKRQGVVGTDPFTTHGNLLLEIRNGSFSNNIVLGLEDFAAIANIGSTQDPFSGAVDNWHTSSLSNINLGLVNKYGSTQFRLIFAKDDNDDLGADYVKLNSGNSGSGQPELIVTYSTSSGAGNQAPIINGGASISISLPENTMTVAGVTAVDPNGQQITYSISGADTGKFSINSGTGVLSFVSPPDFETIPSGTVYHVTAQASDGILTSTQDIAVTVTPVNEFAPVITSNGGGAVANISVPEGAVDVTTIIATDADLPAPTIEYVMAGGADWQLFNLDASGKVSFVTPPSYNTPDDSGLDHIYNFRVEVHDGEQGTLQEFVITVLDSNIPTGEMLDTSFGTSGIVTTKFDNRPSSILGLGLQSDGKIVVLGSAKVSDDNSDYTYRKFLTRYSPNGVMDTSFGTNGITPVEFEFFNASAMELQADGKIVVGGGGGQVSVARYNNNGALDTSFGTNGISHLDIYEHNGSVRDVAIQSDGKIVLVGDHTQGQANYTEFFIARFTSSGQVDTSFVANGFNIIDSLPNYRYAYGEAVAIQADGKIVISGNMTDNDGKSNLALVRLNQDGSYDKTGFGTNGRGNVITLIPDFQTSDGALVIQADGKIVAFGEANSNLVLVRYNTNGTLDTTFGGTGIVSTDSGQTDQARDLTLQTDGKIIVCGTIWNANSKDILLARYNTDGSLDTSFGTNGMSVTNIGMNNDAGSEIIRQPDGKVIVGGASGQNALLARYHVGAPAASSSLTFKSIGTQDGWILESGENTNQGDTLEKVSNALFVGDDAKDRQYRSILSFDTTTIPDNVTVASAQLRIRKQGIVGTDPTGTHGNLFLEIRNGTFSNTVALNVEDFAVTANIGSTQDVFSAIAGDWYVADLSSINAGLINKYGFTQFRLRFTKDDNDDLGADYDRFFSGNSETNQPELIVTYSTPGALASTPAPAVISMAAEPTQSTQTPMPPVVEPAPSTQFTALHQFGSQADNGRIPYGVLVLYNGVFYGTTTYGGPPYNVPPVNPDNKGNIFRMNMDGTGYTVLHEFTGGANDGWKPWVGLAVSGDMIYGSTVYGGLHGENGGVIYEMNVNGSGFRVLHAFGDPGDGFGGSTSPILVGDTLFGITRWGGNGTGTIYSYNTTTEVYTQLHRFAADSSDGNAPLGALTLAKDGYLYGLTWLGGRNNMGTLFRIKPDGSAFETMYHFEGGALGKYPYDNLAFDGDHTLYGTTLGVYGVDNSDLGVIFKYDIINRSYSILHTFAGGAGDSGKPNGSVVLSSDGVTLYGTTHGDDAWGGSEFGILYKMNLDGSNFQQLYEFSGGAAGATPMHTPLLANGALYGMTAYGGAENYGLIYRYQVADAAITQKSFSMASLFSPVINSGAEISISENSTAVTTVTATDADTPTLTYSIVGGADAALFGINSSTGELTFLAAPDFEQPKDSGADNIYNLTVQASDGMLTATQDVSVTVTGVTDNAPLISSSGTVSIAENISAVTTLTATDADLPAQALTYSIIGGADSALFAVNTSTGELTFLTAPDFEQPKDAGADNIYNFTAQVSDGTFSTAQDVIVTVTPVNDNTPAFSSPAGLSTAENSTTVATLSATDADLPAQALIYSILGGTDAAYFNLNPITGVLSFISAHDYELPNDADRNNVYNLTVQVSDGTLTTTQEISVSVLPVNDNTPVITSPDRFTIPENTLTVATITATDADRPAQVLTYAIVGGLDALKFSIVSATGELKFVTAPDFEVPTDINHDNIYEVTVQVSDGVSNVTKNISAQVMYRAG
jgi:uncharacterized delta-60 repeat protein